MRNGSQLSIRGIACTLCRGTSLGPKGGVYRVWSILRNDSGRAISSRCPDRESAVHNAESNIIYYGTDYQGVTS
jgi:hypothetical protein